MDINTWLTVVTIFIGIVTVLPKEERTLLQLKLYKAEYITFFIVLVGVIPFLILFPSIANRYPLFWKLTIHNGFHPANIAFAFFYLLFLWVIVRMVFLRPKARINEHIISFFRNALTEMQFPQFLSLFTKYTSPDLLRKDWDFYKEIVQHPDFLNGVSKFRPTYFNNLWDFFEDDKEFKLAFSPFLADPKSAYYIEIKANDGISTVLGNNPFLQSVIVTHLIKNRENGMLYIVSDQSKRIIRSEKGKSESIYLQPHQHVHTKGEEGYDLPLYYHIRFIWLMYDTAISNKVKTHSHIHTLFGGMIEEMISNLSQLEEDPVGEYPTNYHWLISKMFSAMNDWLIDFGGEHPNGEYENGTVKFEHIYFDSHSSYVDFIPSIMNFSCKALYKGLDEGKLEVKFVARKIYYGILTEYFSHRIHAEVKTSIEENVIKNIPKEYVESIVDLALDEAFANHFYAFRNKQFRGSGIDQQEQERLWKALNNYGLL